MLRTPGWNRAGSVAVVVVVTLAMYNITRSTLLPDDTHFIANATSAAAIAAIGVLFGLGLDEFGLARADAGSGLRLGMPVAAAITAVVVVAGLVPTTSGLFDDDRVDVSFAEMAVRVLLVIPVGTVLVEELIFRGVLHGVLRRRFEIVPAAAIGAFVFGLWHLFPVWRSYAGSTAFDDAARWGDVVGTFVATFVAGLGFVWLRHRSNHLIAPSLAHVATNSVPFAVAWFIAN